MKITKNQLRQIIQEELAAVLEAEERFVGPVDTSQAEERFVGPVDTSRGTDKGAIPPEQYSTAMRQFYGEPDPKHFPLGAYLPQAEEPPSSPTPQGDPVTGEMPQTWVGRKKKHVQHDIGRVLDKLSSPKMGMKENKMKISKTQLRRIVKEAINRTLNEAPKKGGGRMSAGGRARLDRSHDQQFARMRWLDEMAGGFEDWGSELADRGLDPNFEFELGGRTMALKDVPPGAQATILTSGAFPSSADYIKRNPDWSEKYGQKAAVPGQTSSTDVTYGRGLSIKTKDYPHVAAGAASAAALTDPAAKGSQSTPDLAPDMNIDDITYGSGTGVTSQSVEKSTPVGKFLPGDPSAPKGAKFKTAAPKAPKLAGAYGGKKPKFDFGLGDKAPDSKFYKGLNLSETFERWKKMIK